MKIHEAVSDIRNKNLVLPEFQREYVWSREQAKQLLVSLTRKYPVGGLLFWKTHEPPELKNVDTIPERLGTVQVILDGQQRLTTLYMLLTGEIPPYYKGRDILNEIRDLFYNLNNGEFQYFQPVLHERGSLLGPSGRLLQPELSKCVSHCPGDCRRE